jgi:outer membrane lipoprotein-sorting protein
MLRKLFLSSILLLSTFPLPAAENAPTAPVKLTAAEIVEKNIAARGGLKNWHAVQTMSMSGKLEAGGTQNTELPFVMEMKRPRKTRFELQFNGQTAVQVYDGVNGWKLRPFLNRHEVEPYTPEETKAASLQSDLDGPLMDYAAKGTKVELEGIQSVEGRDAYNLKLTLKTGQVQHVWVDAKTYLEAKIEGTPRRLDGKYRAVETYLRDYRAETGLMVPHLIETSVAGAKRTEKIRIETVRVNPTLEDSRFTKPQ